MNVTTGSARRQAIIAGVVTFVVAMLPTAGILWSAASGSVGSVSKTGLGVVAIAVIGAISVGSGYLIDNAYESEPSRRPGDVWSTWYGGFVFFVLGTWISPFLILVVFVNSDRALNDQLPLVLTVWTALHLASAGIGLFFARGLLHQAGSPNGPGAVAGD